MFCTTCSILFVAVIAIFVKNIYGVYWNVTTTPIVFRRNVTLKCTASKDCCYSLSWKWTRGSNNEPISFNEGSVNRSKYDAKREPDGISLVIQDFDDSDANKSYTCIYGFDEFTNDLTVNDYELHPANNTTNVLYEILNETIVIQIEFSEVYPEPKCALSFNTINVPFKVDMLEVNGVSMKVKTSVSYKLDEHACGRKLKVVCDVGQTTINVLNVPVREECVTEADTNFGESGHTTDTTTAIIVILCVCAFIASAIYCGFKFVKRRKKVQKTIALNSNLAVEMQPINSDTTTSNTPVETDKSDNSRQAT